MSNILSIIIVAILGIIGNIFYFEYRIKKERRKEILKKRLTELLLPLYYALRTDEFLAYAWFNSDEDFCEYESEKPERLFKNLSKIIEKNLYLADDELHWGCIQFIEWTYRADKNARFQRVHKSNLEEDEVLKIFSTLVEKKYDEARDKYLK